MKKIPTLFRRDPENMSRVIDELVVDLPEGAVPTLKWDGTCVMRANDSWWGRRTVKPGKTAPASFREVEHDPVTGKRFGWVPIEESSFHAQLLDVPGLDVLSRLDGTNTYELVGPKINGNPHRFANHHRVLCHGQSVAAFQFPHKEFLADPCWSVTFMLEEHPLAEGFVWWHNDEPVAKVKQRDFSLPWPPRSSP